MKHTNFINMYSWRVGHYYAAHCTFPFHAGHHINCIWQVDHLICSKIKPIIIIIMNIRLRMSTMYEWIQKRSFAYRFIIIQITQRNFDNGNSNHSQSPNFWFMKKEMEWNPKWTTHHPMQIDCDNNLTCHDFNQFFGWWKEPVYRLRQSFTSAKLISQWPRN